MDIPTLLALLELAERAPKSRTEMVWLAAISKTINDQIIAQESAENETPKEPEPKKAKK